MPPMTPSTVSDHLTCPNEAAATGAGVISENLRVQRVLRRYPPVNIQKTIENGHLYLIYPLKMMIFNSYVSLPEGMGQYYKQLLAFNMFQHVEKFLWNICFNICIFDHLPKFPKRVENRRWLKPPTGMCWWSRNHSLSEGLEWLE